MLVEAPCAIGCDAAALACVRPLALGVGSEHACALLDDGTLRCWGSDQDDQLGDGGVGADASRPRNVPGVTGATGLEVNFARTCALGPAGALCWGKADPAVDVDAVPTAPAIAGPVRDVALGANHLCVAVGRADQFFRRGDNFLSRLGAGDGARHDGFGDVASQPVGAERIAAGAGHNRTLAGGALPFCRGDGFFGARSSGAEQGAAAIRCAPAAPPPYGRPCHSTSARRTQPSSASPSAP